MAYQRPQLQQVTAKLIEPRSFIQVLYGPRQVGKTTLIRQALGNLEIPNHFASADLVTNGQVSLIKS